MNAKPPSERREGGERRRCDPLEAEIDALMKRVDPVPEEVVKNARRAFDRRWHQWGPTRPSRPNDHEPNGTPADTGSGDSG